MKAEDVKPGMWVRWVGADVAEPCRAPWKVTSVRDGQIHGVAVDGVWCADDTCARLEPWTPRVGERISAPSIGPGHGVVYFVADGGVITEGGYMVPFDKIEPCPPPEAKPAREMTCEEHLDAIAAEPRDHNATCAKCGGRAYQGLLNARCIEPVCDDPETRMPERVWSSIEEDERVWTAAGRGVFADHPLREGAIHAWREAVRGR